MIKIYAQNPNEKAVARVADVLRSDGVIVYPTDSVYACLLYTSDAADE